MAGYTSVNTCLISRIATLSGLVIVISYYILPSSLEKIVYTPIYKEQQNSHAYTRDLSAV
jgi:hypothetical protein